MTGLFKQKFKLDITFDNLSEHEFTEKLSTLFQLNSSTAKLIFDGVFSYKKEFLFSDFENYLSQDEQTTFFANPLVI